MTALARVLLMALPVSLLAADIPAAELKPHTAAAFDRYIQLTESRIDGELKTGHPFLYLDDLAEQARAVEYRRLKEGEVLVQALATKAGDKKLEAPDGIIHHWVGLVFIPGVSLTETLRFVQDYDQHHRFYAPDVVRSRLLERDGDSFHIFYRLKKQKLITVVMNTEYDVRYFRLDDKRVHSRSYSTRIAEVKDPGEATESEKPMGRDGGFMWRLYTYWRFQEKDGGVYVQCEAVSLTRDIPTGLGWLIRPFISGIPKESLGFTLGRTRDGLKSTRAGSD